MHNFTYSKSHILNSKKTDEITFNIIFNSTHYIQNSIFLTSNKYFLNN